MKAKTNKIEAYLQSHGGVARFSSILRAGFHPDVLKNLEKENKIEKVGKGLYRLTRYTLGSHPTIFFHLFRYLRELFVLSRLFTFIRQRLRYRAL